MEKLTIVYMQQNVPANIPQSHGLSSLEAGVRLKEYGENARPRQKSKGKIRRLADIFFEPMMLLLLATGVVYLFLGDKVDTIVIFISIIPIAIIEFIQEERTSNALALLDGLMVDKCKVFRDGNLITLETRFIVPGDAVFVAAGDKLPADGTLIESNGLMVDEAILTGESAPVVKSRALSEPKDENTVFQGTLVVQGEGVVRVLNTGSKTVYGKLGNLLEKIEIQKTPLQKKIEKLVRGVAVGAGCVAILIGIMVGLKNGILPGLLGGLTVAISIIPEEFPIIFSVFLIMGVWRLSKEKALVRQMVMVETLGSATVICSDKTGTLTEGTMSLTHLYYDNALHDASTVKSAECKQFIRDALLAIEQVAVDPIEHELQRYGKSIGLDSQKLYSELALRKDGFFDAATKMVHHTWDSGAECYQYTAGAPEFIIRSSTLTDAERVRVMEVYHSLAKDGSRVIAVAKTTCSDTNLFRMEGLEFRGLIAMSDPPRAGVAEAIKVCQEAGMRVLMITGDNSLTARSIAEQIGIKVIGAVEGATLENANKIELQTIVRTNTIFARVKPEQKYLIVEALQESGEVVAMTGDGVNDAPALKKANIGIAMGQKGTEVARAAAGMVLLDDNFATIVNAVREGRRIYDNMRRAFGYLLAFHIPIVGLSVIPVALGQPLFFMPIHIIFLELFCDPAVVLGFERDPMRHTLMSEKPRPASEPLIPKKLWRRIITQGLAMFAVSFGFYFFGRYVGDMEKGRTLAFAALVLAEVILVIFTHEWRQLKHNRLLSGILLGTIGMLGVILFSPFFSTLFHFVPVSFSQLGLVAGSVIVVMFLVKQLGK